MAEATQTKTTIAIDPVTRIEGHLKTGSWLKRQKSSMRN